MLTLRPAIFDRDVLALDIANFAQAAAERSYELRESGRRRIGEVANHRHRRLLRARRERPRRRRGAGQRDELAALCMSGKQHSERRRGFGHDRLPVATGSPQALRISNRE
jgi:hypothetical protein